MSRPGKASRIARVPLFALIVLLAVGSIGSIVMAGRARVRQEAAMVSQAQSAVQHTLSSIFSDNDLSAMSSPSRAATLNQELSVALGATSISDVTLYNTMGTILYDIENSRIGDKMLGQRPAIKTANHGGVVPSIVGTNLTVMLPIQRFGTQGTVMFTMPKAPIDAAGRPWTAAGLIMALAILPALFMLWWVGRIADSAGANISFRRKQMSAVSQQALVIREPLRPPRREMERSPVREPAQHGLKEEGDARRMAEERAKAAEERLSVLQEQYRKTLDELHLKERTPTIADGDPALEERALHAEGKLRLMEGQLRAVSEERDKLEGALRGAPSPAGGPDPKEQADRERIQAELAGVRAELEGTQTQLSAARRQLDSVAEAAERTQGERAERALDLERELDAAHVQILSSQEALERAHAEAKTSGAQATSLQTDLTSLREAHHQAVRDRDATMLQAREESESLHRELESTKAMAGEESEAVRAHVDLARTLQADLEKAQTEARTARETLADAQAQLRTASVELDGAKGLVDGAHQEIAAREAALAQANARAGASEQAAHVHESSLQQALGELERLQAEIMGGGEQADQARQALTAQAQRIRELQQQLESARSEMLRTQETSSVAEAQMSAARTELEATRKELRALRNEEQRAAMLEDELRATRAELENVQASHRAELVERDADLEARVRRTREDFQTEFAAASEQLTISRAELGTTRNELSLMREAGAAAAEESAGQAARADELAERTDRAEQELRAQQAATRKTVADLQEATEANADLARKLQDLENRRQLELADENGQLEMDQILHATQERLAGQTDRLMEMEERAREAERSVEVLNERLDETLSQLRSTQMADALRDLRTEEHTKQGAAAAASDSEEGQDVVRLEDRRASSPFLKELTLDAKKSLTQILGITQILKYKKDAKDQAQLVKQLTAYARRLDLTVSDLADADKLARGSVELTVRRTDLEALVQRVVSESDVSDNHDVRVMTEPLICGVDQLRTEQVLAGLLRASADRTAPGKSIVVTLQHTEGGALISVSDPETSSDASLSPVVQRFAEIQGGWAKVDSREDGTGSLFRVFLPDGGINGAAAEDTTSQTGADLHIVVDDAAAAQGEGPWGEEDQDMLVREIGRLAEPS